MLAVQTEKTKTYLQIGIVPFECLLKMSHLKTLLSGLAASLKGTVTADVKVRKHCLQVLILLETVNDLNCVVLQLHSEFAAQDNQGSCRLGWLGGNQSR